MSRLDEERQPAPSARAPRSNGGRKQPDADATQRQLPQARPHHRRVSWVWLLPAAALLLVAYLMFAFISQRGPLITVTFETADGLSANQTEVKYRAVTLGTVEEIELTDDLSHVVVSIRMADEAESLLTETTRFWVVRPRLSDGLGAFQAGLETLVSGVYVAMDPGREGNATKTHFEGLETPPSVRSDEPGTVYFLRADALGGLSAGAPIYYRDVRVGEVLSYELVEATDEVTLRIFVREPYDEQVMPETRFWNASGLNIDTGAEGLSIELQSARTLLTGGIAFRTPPSDEQLSDERQPAKPDSMFRLYENRHAAEVGFYRENIPYVSYFQSSVRGLATGSEVHMFGRRLGSVTDVHLVRDPRPDHEQEFAVRVAYVLQPERALAEPDEPALHHSEIGALVADNMRIVLKSSNFLTGQKVLSLEYVSGAEDALPLVKEGEALVLPSTTQDIEDLGASLAEIANNINRIPFAAIGNNLNRTLASIDQTVSGPELRNALVSVSETLHDVQDLVENANAGLEPTLERLPRIAEKLENAVDRADDAFGREGYGENSAVQRNLERMMSEIASAARSIRLLTDYLNRHPEAVLSGREAED